MKKWILRNKHYCIAIFFLIIQIIISYYNFKIQRPDVLIWFCNHTPLFFSIGFFFKNNDITKSIINVGLIPQLIWIIDFLGKIIFNTYIFDVTRYIFEDFTGLALVGSILSHIFATILALYFTYKHKPISKIILVSFVYIVVLFFTTLFFTPVHENVNLIYYVNIGNISFPGYTILWPVLVLIIIVIPTYYFQVFLYDWSKNKKDSFKKTL